MYIEKKRENMYLTCRGNGRSIARNKEILREQLHVVSTFRE